MIRYFFQATTTFLRTRESLGAFLAVAIMSAFFIWAIVMPTSTFPSGERIEIVRGETLSAIATKLYDRSVIRSPLLYKLLVRTVAPTHGALAGDYVFDRPMSLFEIVARTTNLSFGQSSIRVTIPEGMHNRQIAELLELRFKSFDKAKFLEVAKPFEGYLFPDTYIFSKGTPEEDIVSVMRENFFEKIKEYEKEIASSGRSQSDVVIMASLLEREARTKQSREIIAGILWKRLDKGVALQLDAPLYYLYGKPTSEITKADLADQSLYNTYKHKGLPPGPIANPGIYSIRDALNPKPTKYWFYLSDAEGEMHYAATYEQHLANKRRYID